MQHKTNRLLTAVIALMLLMAVGLGYAAINLSTAPVQAAPDVVGDPEGATDRLLIRDNETVKKIVYVESGAKTMANTTPVASAKKCSNVGDLHEVEVHFTGTMTGTAPTLNIQWQNSIDNGNTWTNVGTITQYNATQTANVAGQTVADQYSTTAVAFGDCWRVTYTFGGSGTVTANFEVVGLEK